jgi:hypothetical protein
MHFFDCNHWVKDIKAMNRDQIVFAMANPIPEILPEEAGPYVRVMATGRSDYPNQIDNSCCFPGFFRGMLDVRAWRVNDEMRLAAAQALAAIVTREELGEEYITPVDVRQPGSPHGCGGGRADGCRPAARRAPAGSWRRPDAPVGPVAGQHEEARGQHDDQGDDPENPTPGIPLHRGPLRGLRHARELLTETERRLERVDVFSRRRPLPGAPRIVVEHAQGDAGLPRRLPRAGGLLQEEG